MRTRPWLACSNRGRSDRQPAHLTWRKRCPISPKQLPRPSRGSTQNRSVPRAEPFSLDKHRVRCPPLSGCEPGLLLPPSASFCRNRKLEDRPFLGSRLHPNPASMFFNNLLANRQSYAGASIIRSVQSSENTENLVMIRRRYADAIVA